MAFGTVKYSFVFIVVLVSLFNGILSILKVIAKTQPVPYIDEIFHIPQAQHYCRYEFDKWDNKITTLPGLYIISIAILKPMEKALGLELCSAYGLRFVNVLGTIFNFLLFYAVQQKLHPTKKGSQGSYVEVMSAVNVATFPPLFFFTFLYYTDVWSTAFVMLMYLLHISQYPLLGAIAGLGAVLMRQTNIIWLGLVMVLTAWKALVGPKNVNASSIKEIYQITMEALKKPFFFRVLHATSPYLAVCCLFVIFILINGGIVVGDRTSHKPVVHPMQALYFVNIAALFALPYIIFEFRSLFSTRYNIPLFCTLWIGISFLSEYNLLQHPYLLADNRHLAFYIWRRTFGHPVVRRLLTPSYLLCGLCLLQLLKKQNLVFTLTLVLCTIANLTPQYLFEIRYFIVPFLLARVHFTPRKPAILLETLFFAGINAFVLYLFLNKHFYWASEPRVQQRIIW